MAAGRILHGHRVLELLDSAAFSDDGAMERRIVPGAVVEHAGKRWRVERVLGADSVLLRSEGGGPPVAADPARVTFPDQAESAVSLRRVAAMQCTEADWAEAVRRRDLLLCLAQQQDHPTAEIDAVAKELGLKPRRVWQLLRLIRTRGPDIANFLPARRQPRTKRLAPDVEAVIAQAIAQHYAKPSRPSLFSLSREVDRRCTAAGLAPPSYDGACAAKRPSVADAPARGRGQGQINALADRRPPRGGGAVGTCANRQHALRSLPSSRG